MIKNVHVTLNTALCECSEKRITWTVVGDKFSISCKECTATFTYPIAKLPWTLKILYEEETTQEEKGEAKTSRFNPE